MTKKSGMPITSAVTDYGLINNQHLKPGMVAPALVPVYQHVAAVAMVRGKSGASELMF